MTTQNIEHRTSNIERREARCGVGRSMVGRFSPGQGGFKVGARTAVSARLCRQILFARTRLSALQFPRFLNPPGSPVAPFFPRAEEARGRSARRVISASSLL